MIHILTGARGAGKSTTLVRTVRLLQEAGIVCAGFAVLRKGPPEVKREGRYLWEAGGGGLTLLAWVDPQARAAAPFISADGLGVGPYRFDPAGLAAGLSLLRQSAQVKVLDEVGLLEMAGHGFAQGIESLAECREALVVVRWDCLDWFAGLWPVAPTVHQVVPENREELPHRIVQLILSAK